MTASFVEQTVEDVGFTLLLLLSGMLSLGAIAIFLFGQTAWMAPLVAFSTSLRVYALPWIAALAILSIGREMWMIRIYAEHMHVGSEIQRVLASKGGRR
jgi:hypothetical protein